MQVKTARLKASGSGIEFNCKSTHATSGGNKILSYDATQIDYYMTCWENEFYLIPVTECGSSIKSLRILPYDTPQSKQCQLAEKYIAKEVVKFI